MTTIIVRVLPKKSATFFLPLCVRSENERSSTHFSTQSQALKDDEFFDTFRLSRYRFYRAEWIVARPGQSQTREKKEKKRKQRKRKERTRPQKLRGLPKQPDSFDWVPIRNWDFRSTILARTLWDAIVDGRLHVGFLTVLTIRVQGKVTMLACVAF